LLNYYRSAPKETRDKANLMISEKKLRQELEETRNELKKVQNYAKTLRKKCTEDEVSYFFENIRTKFQIDSLLSLRFKTKYNHFNKQFVILKKI
jgi:hypothetical protein